MRNLILAIIMLCGVNVWASGRISIQPTQSFDGDRVYFIAGLAIYEKLGKHLAYNSWSGLGEGIGEQSNKYYDWYTSKHQLDFYMKRLTVSPGVRVIYDPQENRDYYEGFAKFSFELWK